MRKCSYTSTNIYIKYMCATARINIVRKSRNVCEPENPNQIFYIYLTILVQQCRFTCAPHGCILYMLHRGDNIFNIHTKANKEWFLVVSQFISIGPKIFRYTFCINRGRETLRKSAYKCASLLGVFGELYVYSNY